MDWILRYIKPYLFLLLLHKHVNYYSERGRLLRHYHRSVAPPCDDDDDHTGDKLEIPHAQLGSSVLVRKIPNSQTAVS